MNRRLPVSILAAVVALGGLSAVTPQVHAAAASLSTTSAARVKPATNTSWKPRSEQFPATAMTTDLAIPMSDGVTLRADLVQPVDSSGKTVTTPLPVIITITAYNKTVIGMGGGLGGTPADYLVKRGYAQLTVDARGTGTSEGVWGAFSKREAKDAAAIVNWAAEQPWSDGTSGMTGPSYMGISQIFAAARHPKGLKAIFPQVPGADVYRDVVASGGAIDVGFIPLWLGIVTSTGLIPPAYGLSEPEHGFKWLSDSVLTAATFTVPLISDALIGGDAAYDGKFYEDRSPINVIDKVTVPTFLISGEYDLFQRGTPLLFERLQRNGVPTRIITGPWDHLEGSSGAEVADAGYGTLAELQLRWFDHYVKDIADPSLLTDIKPYTYFEQGTNRWVRKPNYVSPDLEATTLKLSGSATPSFQGGTLTTGRAAAGTAIVPPLPVAGLCSRSANQWTAGIMNTAFPANPCLSDNQYNDYAGVSYDSAPLTKKLRIQGPINARLFTSTPTGDGMLSVSISDVAPNGTVKRLTGGWQVISHRALDQKRSRYLDGKLIQAYHPFTRAEKSSLGGNQVAPIDVEIFPTGAAIKPGHRLRINIQAFDVPHLLPTLPDLPAMLAPMTIHVSKRYPSELTLPTR
ncbi:MAG: CocE/NonD family hydrolase [Nocardioides sp.]